MTGPFAVLCQAIGLIVVIVTLASVAWLCVSLCVEAWRDRRADRSVPRSVPRSWVIEERRRQDHDHPSRRGGAA